MVLQGLRPSKSLLYPAIIADTGGSKLKAPELSQHRSCRRFLNKAPEASPLAYGSDAESSAIKLGNAPSFPFTHLSEPCVQANALWSFSDLSRFCPLRIAGGQISGGTVWRSNGRRASNSHRLVSGDLVKSKQPVTGKSRKGEETINSALRTRVLHQKQQQRHPFAFMMQFAH